MNVIADKSLEVSSLYEPQAQLFKLLTHPVRLAILDILRDGEHCVCHMEAYLGYRQAYISQQVAVLREAGLIQDRREGWNIFYRVTDLRIYSAIDMIQLISGQTPGLPKKDVDCPCPHCSVNQKT
jgi:DNA-binding transcriptional ArsR family regulator